MPSRERRRLLRGEFISGTPASPKSASSRATQRRSLQIVIYDGFENFERAYARGKGVLFLTGHLGAWELSAFAHSCKGIRCRS